MRPVEQFPLDRRKVWRGAPELDDQISQFVERVFAAAFEQTRALFLISKNKPITYLAVEPMLPHDRHHLILLIEPPGTIATTRSAVPGLERYSVANFASFRP